MILNINMMQRFGSEHPVIMVVGVGTQRGHIREVCLQAFSAIDVEFYAVPDDGAGDIATDQAQHALHRAGPEFADGAAGDADSVVVVLSMGETVARLSVDEAKLADDAGFKKELDGAEDRSPTYNGQLANQIIGGEALAPVFKRLDDDAPRERGAIALVLKDGQNVSGV